MGQAWFRPINRKLGIVLFITLILVAAQSHVQHSSAQEGGADIPFTQRYDDPEFGWSLMHPEGWGVEIRHDNPGTPDYVIKRRTVVYDPQGDAAVIDVWANAAGTDLVTWFNENHARALSSSATLKIATEPNAQVAGVNAILVTDSYEASEEPLLPRYVAVFRNDTHVFRIEYLRRGSAGDDIFAALLASFQFDSAGGIAGQSTATVDLSALVPLVDNVWPIASCGGYVDPTGGSCPTGNPFPCCDSGGNCTWWARYKRPDFGCDMLHNAKIWYPDAIALGYPVGQTPRTTAVAVWNNSEYGHVAYVEDGRNGTEPFYISEMGCWSGGPFWRNRSKGDLTGFLGFIYTKNTCTNPGVPSVIEPDPGEERTANFQVELQPGAHNPCTGKSDYQVQIDNNSNFSSPEFDNTARDGHWSTSKVITNITLPSPGVYYVRARQGDTVSRASGWSASVWFYYNGPDPERPTQVKLKTPRHDSATADTTPRLSWSKAKYAVRYYLQVDDQPDFSSPIISNDQITGTSFTVPPETTLLYNRYFWRVVAINQEGRWSTGGWSPTRSFWVTLSQSPKNGDFTKDTTPVFKWKKLSGATQYEFQLDNNSDFSSTLYTQKVSGTSFTVPNGLGLGRYYWRVRAQRADGSWTDVMPTWAVTVTQTLPGKPVLVSPENKWLATSPTITFTWQAAENAASYQFQIANTRNFASLYQDITAGGLSQTVTGLKWTPVYYWRVRALNAEGVAGSWSSVWTIQITGPAAPMQISPNDRAVTNDTTPTLAWNAVAGVTGYQIHLAYDKNFNYRIADVHQGELSWTAPVLKDGTYYWRVRGYGANQFHGTWSKTWRVTVDTVGPQAPKLRTPRYYASTTDPRPAFNWGGVRGAVQYQLQIDNNSDFGSLVFNKSGITSARYDLVEPDPALSHGTWYYWRVRAKDKAGNWGPWSNNFAVSISILQSPKHTASTADSTPSFRWKKVSDAASYTLQVCTDWACNNPVFTSPAVPTNKFTLSSPLNPGFYLWRVKVVTTGGGSYWSGVFGVYITPAPPKKIKLTSPPNRWLTNDNSVTLRWLPQDGITRYRVQVDDDKGFKSLNINVKFDSSASPVTYVTSMANPLPDGTYYWRVQGINSQGAPGPWSQRRMFTIDTTPPLTPAVIGPANDTRQTNTKLKLQWFKSDGAARYEVQLDTDSAFPRPAFDVGRKTSYKPTTPLIQTTWYWRVRAVDKAGNYSAWSSTRALTIVAGNTAIDTPVPTDVPPTDAPPVLIPVEPTQPPSPNKPVEPTPAQPPQDGKVPPPDSHAPPNTRHG
jgi:surface antigen